MKSDLVKLRGHKCEECGNEIWNNNPIPLEVHHVSGKSDCYDNLKLLCPNCHALTSNYRGRGIRTGKTISDDDVAIAASESNNIKQLLEKLGLVAKGGNYKSIRNRLVKLDLINKFRQPEPVKACPNCKLEFIGNRTFCCQTCSNKFNRNGLKTVKVANRPSQDVLLQMIRTMGYSATGRVFGVSDNAVRKWLR